MPVFSTPQPILLTLEVIVADVRITAADRRDTVVDIKPSNSSHANDVTAAEQTRVELTPTGVLIKAPKQRGLGIFGKPGSIEVTVEVPSKSQIRGDSSIGSFHVSGQAGDCTIKTSVGSIHLDHVGSADLNTSSGSVTVDRIDGNADIKNGNGKVRVGHITGRAVIKNSNGDNWVGFAGDAIRTTSSNGDVVVDYAASDISANTAMGDVRVGDAVEGTLSLKTACGGIELGIHPGTAARLDVHTSFGKVRNKMTSTPAPNPTEKTLDVIAHNGFGDIVIRRALPHFSESAEKS